VVFAPVDFRETTLAVAMRQIGLDLAEPAFFSWLGVLFYLPQDIALAMLEFIGRTTAPGSEIVFDYLVPPSMLGLAGQNALAFLRQSAGELGEPWRTFFVPEQMTAELTRLGFEVVTDVGAEEFARASGGREEKTEALGFTRLVRARVAHRSADGDVNPPASATSI
jgi:O-methyltransferase involved in polyketide biosynthesis